MADVLYNRGLSEWGDNFTGGTIKALLVQNTYVPDPDHDFVASVASDEVADASYARKTLASKTETVDDVNNRVKFDCADIVWTALAGGDTVSAVVIYLEVTNDADSILLAYYDVPNQVTSGTDYTFAPHADGLAYYRSA